MKTTHSPAPWRAEGYKNTIVNSATGYTLCLFPAGSPECSVEEIQANARLISAAPELLEACLGLLEAYAFNAQKSADESGEDSLHPSVKAARAAITKATQP